MHKFLFYNKNRGCPRKTWMERVQAAMTTNLEPNQWRNREEWRLVSGKRRQLLKKQTDRLPLHVSSTMCSSSGGQNCIIQHLVSLHL